MNKNNINLTFIRGGKAFVGMKNTLGEHWMACNKVTWENKFYLPVRGTGELFIDGTHYKLEKYKWFLIGEGEARSYYTLPGDELEKYVVHFYSDTGENTLKEFFDLPDCIELDEEEYKKALALMTQTENDEFVSSSEIYKLFSNKSNVYSTLSYYIELACKKGLHKSCHADETSLIRYMIFEYIKSIGIKDITTRKIAQAMGMNENYFLKYFKKLFFITLHQFIYKTRMLKALWRLADSPYSVNEITESCGFESVSHFIKLFKAQTGMTPLKFRNNYFNTSLASDSSITLSSDKH